MSEKPARFSFDDFISELIEIHEDVAECRTRLGEDRKRRLAILERLTFLMQIGRPQVFDALKGAARALDPKRD
jgi:hypothetical protein